MSEESPPSADELNPEKAGILLKTSQDLRTHWSSLITNIMSFMIVLLTAVWTFLGKAYIDTFNTNKNWDNSFVALAATFSIIVIVIWRWYTLYLDNNIVNLYPDMVYFEGKLSIPTDYGTTAYLARQMGKQGIRFRNIKYENLRANIIRKLIEERIVGGRGHEVINYLLFALIIIMAVILVFGLGIYELIDIGGGVPSTGFKRDELKWICGGFSVLGYIGMIIILCRQQSNPCEKQLGKIITELGK